MVEPGDQLEVGTRAVAARRPLRPDPAGRSVRSRPRVRRPGRSRPRSPCRSWAGRAWRVMRTAVRLAGAVVVQQPEDAAGGHGQVSARAPRLPERLPRPSVAYAARLRAATSTRGARRTSTQAATPRRTRSSSGFGPAYDDGRRADLALVRGTSVAGGPRRPRTRPDSPAPGAALRGVMVSSAALRTQLGSAARAWPVQRRRARRGRLRTAGRGSIAAGRARSDTERARRTGSRSPPCRRAGSRPAAIVWPVRVLLTNDDGIEADGPAGAAARAARRPRTSSSRSSPPTPTARRSAAASPRAGRCGSRRSTSATARVGYATDGTPVDCVRFAALGLVDGFRPS